MTIASDMQGPLAGLNVLDFGHWYAAPMVAMMLADQGAKVIRIARPNEDGSSGYHQELPERQYRLFNRNKKIVVLDLKSDAGKTQALALIQEADILIENFRPGVMQRLGLDYTSVKSSNPGLVYLSLPGFASTDKERAHLQAWEGVMGAASCLYTAAGLNRTPLSFPPVYTDIPHCSIYGALHGAVSVVAAIISREKNGVGTVIEVPMVDAGLAGFLMDIQYGPSGEWQPDGELPDFLSDLVFSTEDSRDAQVQKLKQAEMRGPLMGTPSSGFRICSDGRQILVFTLWEGVDAIESLFKVLGIQKQLMAEGFVWIAPWRQPGLENNVCDSGGLNSERLQRLNELISEAFLGRTAEEWEILLNDAGVLAAVVRTRQEWLALSPMLDSGVLVDMESKESVLRVPGRIAEVNRLSDTVKPGQTSAYREPELITQQQAERFFGHRAPINVESSQSTPIKKGDLLSGLKVLDKCSYLAGPSGAYLLATLGADVIKLDVMTPLLPPGEAIRSFFPGKRALIADIKTHPGRQVFQQLVSWADIVMDNSLDDLATRLGTTATDLEAINSSIVSCQFSGYGGTHRGGWEDRKGVEPMLQCASGLMAQFGTLEQPIMHTSASGADVTGGLGFAFSALLGVYLQRKTGQAVEARSSLACGINYYQLPWMITENGRGDWGSIGGQFSVGDSPCQRIYACANGWIYVGASRDNTATLVKTVIDNDVVDERALEAAFASQDCDYWIKTLRSVDVACHQVLNIDDIYHMASRQVDNRDADEVANCASEVLCYMDAPYGKPLYLFAPNCVRVGEAQTYKRLGHYPLWGEDTIEVLKGFNYSEAQIEELERLNVVLQYRSGSS